jgi:hypothetical protein
MTLSTSAVTVCCCSDSVDVVNRDELGALGADVNKMSEELGQLYQQLHQRLLGKTVMGAYPIHDKGTIHLVEGDVGRAKQRRRFDQRVEYGLPTACTATQLAPQAE